MREQKIISVPFNGEEITFKSGHLAFKADSAVEVQMGETVVLAIVTVDKRDTELDYFPLSVEYLEKFYAGGIISGSRFIKRETRPSDSAVLKARQVDHSIRSLFPKGFKKPVSVVITVMSYDDEHDPEDLSVLAASAALMISSVPFDGPSASMKIAYDNNGQIIINPGHSIEETIDSQFIIAVKEDRILNIEGFGNELPEDKMDALIDHAIEAMKPLLEVQKEYAKIAGKEKLEYAETPAPQELIDEVAAKYTDLITEALYKKENRREILDNLKSEIVKEKGEEISKIDAEVAVEYIARKIMRGNILTSEQRTSGRRMDEIRELQIDIGVLPRVHGSALFSRGITQTMTIVTLGSTSLSQSLESFEGEDVKRFMHHYNGPTYSFGDAGRFSYYPGRREIGHGHITENAFEKLLPSEEEFPYTIRVVSEILAQNGSSSMAAATATSLSLMDAGVPIKAPVAGIAIGLVTDDENVMNYKLFTDMEDVEDFYGDMDFKVTGTANGITAIQMDNKLKGVPVEIIKEAFRRAKVGREHILEQTNAVISAPRESVGKYAPKVDKVTIKKDKIGDLIGPAGKNIKKILEQTENKVEVDIKEDGTVYITGVDQELIQKTKDLIEGAVGEVKIGAIYDATVDKIMNFGAFVEINGSTSGLVHVSEMDDSFVQDPNKIVKMGQKVKVKVIGVDDQGRIKLSMKKSRLEAKQEEQPKQ